MIVSLLHLREKITKYFMVKGKNVLQPKQKRSIATKQKIKKVAMKLFSKSGYYSVTSNMIAAEANVPIGSFYNYFKNKKTLMLELTKDFNAGYHDDTFQKYLDIIDSTERSENLLSGVEKSVELFLSSKYLSNPIYKIIHSLQFTEPDILELSEEVRKVELELIDQFLKQVNTFHPIKNIRLKAKLIHSSVENVGLYIHHLGTSFNQKQLIKETAKMLYGYLILDNS